jgi:hypothetical protein
VSKFDQNLLFVDFILFSIGKIGLFSSELFLPLSIASISLERPLVASSILREHEGRSKTILKTVTYFQSAWIIF